MQKEGDCNNIKALWQEGFGDDPAFIDEYLSVWRSKGSSFIRRVGDRVVSAADLHRFKSDITSAGYIYGVVTSGDMRGRGFAGSIVREMLGALYNQGEYLAMLIAADDGLSAWYSGFGFSQRSVKPAELYAGGTFDFGTGTTALNLLQYRIVNVIKYLTLYVLQYPAEEFSVSVKDLILPANDGLYIVEKGRVEVHKNTPEESISVSQLFDSYSLTADKYIYNPL